MVVISLESLRRERVENLQQIEEQLGKLRALLVQRDLKEPLLTALQEIDYDPAPPRYLGEMKEARVILLKLLDEKFAFPKRFEQHIKENLASREELLGALKRGMFATGSFEACKGVVSPPGMYDLGPPGQAVEKNLINIWHQYFCLEDNMVELHSSTLVPDKVLQESGRWEKNLLVVSDKVGKTYYQAEYLLKSYYTDYVEGDNANAEEAIQVCNLLNETFSKTFIDKEMNVHNITAPNTDQTLSNSCEKANMIGVVVDPCSGSWYLRPENLPSILSNFKALFDFNFKRLPLVACEIGKAFCKREIGNSLHTGVHSSTITCNETTLAQFVYFFKHTQKSHPKFSSVEEHQLLLFPKEQQTSMSSEKKFKLRDAVNESILESEVLGYFMGRIYVFLTHLGIHEDRLRFRQRLQHELSPHTIAGWDSEIHSTFGWFSCINMSYTQGKTALALEDNYIVLANEDSGDVDDDSKEVKVVVNKMMDTKDNDKKENDSAFFPLEFSDEVYVQKKLTIYFSTEKIKHDHLGDFPSIRKSLLSMRKKEALHMKVELMDKKKDEFLFEATEEGRKIIVKKGWVKFKEEENKRLLTKDEPSMVDCFFDVGRIMYCIFEHSYVYAPGRMTARERQGKQKQLTAAHKQHMAAERKTAFKFPVHVAPYKCSIFYVKQKEECHEIAQEISAGLTAAGISYRTAFIGTGISDAQEQIEYLGVPLLIRVESLMRIKLQHRYEDKIIVVPRAKILSLVLDLIQGRKGWSEIVADDEAAGENQEEQI